MPLAVKDSFDVDGLPTTGGLRGPLRHADADALAVRRLEAAGAVAIGKTAMDPLAWTTHGQAPGFPPCLNPIDLGLSPGGSSSGSAVAVAAGIVPLALGSDTAGSVRIPASYCGAVGLKPARGSVPLDGCLPLSPSFDTVGVIAGTVRECTAAYEVLAGVPLGSADSVGAPVAVLVDLLEASEPEVGDACHAALERLTVSGVRLEQVRLDWSAPRLGLVLAYELAEVWGEAAEAYPERFPEDILSAIERARTIDARRCARVRRELAEAGQELTRRMSRFSALLSPTVPTPVPDRDAEDVAVSTRFTRIFNALGWAALSVPCGRDRHGHPVGMHVASARGVTEAAAVAELVEKTFRPGA